MVDNQGPVYKKVHNFYYDPSSPISTGELGSMYIGYDITNKDTKYAVKAISIAELLESEDRKEWIQREINILKQIKSEYIVQYIDSLKTSSNLYIISEYCNGHDLQYKLEHQPLTEQEACSVIKQIARAFLDIEELEINSNENKIALMHRDIKPSNILFHDGKVKLADFGYAKIIDDANKNIKMEQSCVGPPLYCAPQILRAKDYSAKCDVWSAGIVLYKILFNRLPWDAKQSEQELYNKIKQNPDLEIPSQISKETEDLLRKMLKFEEGERLTWKEIYEHPALKDCVLY